MHRRLHRDFEGAQVLTSPEELACYRYDSGICSRFINARPDAAILAKSTDDVRKSLAIARDFKLPLIPRGAGTGQAGGSLAPTGGICLDLSAWKDGLQVQPKDFQVFARPGTTLEELNKALAPHGLHLPPDPSSGSACTIGGMVANNAAGQRSLKYGAIGQYVLGLEVVLATGEVITLGGRQSQVLKSVSGLDLQAGLFVGSEGTLGVITGIRLKVVPLPIARAGILLFSSDKKAVPDLVRRLYGAGVVFSACEFVYIPPEAAALVTSVLPALSLPLALDMVLLMEFEGNPPGVAWELKTAQEHAARFPGTVRCAADRTEMDQLWSWLDEAEGAVSSSRPGARRIPGGEDIVVPPSRLSEALDGIRKITNQGGVSCVNFGHAAFGNIHTGLLIKPEEVGEMDRVETIIDEIHNLALQLNGSTTGEHGTGLVRRSLLWREHGEAALLMQRVKDLLDPEGILNPGKILPGAAK